MSVVLKGHGFPGVESKELVQQIEAKEKCREKLPTWFNTPGIYYPNRLNIEQTSSEITAQYKVGIVTGNSLLDLTGGLGVDSYFFSHKIARVVHCEIDPDLAEIAKHNFRVLGRTNIDTHVGDGLAHLFRSRPKPDWIFIDPSRRHNAKGKVFLLSDCLPNVPENLDLILGGAGHIMIKTSPLLDISAGLKELRSVKEVYILSVKNEVKELLWILRSGQQGEIAIKTTNLLPSGEEVFNFFMSDEKRAIPHYSAPLAYLYEPNSAILKSGAFKLIGARYGLHKLHEHSHLYTGDAPISFPGRRFKIERQLPFNKKAIQDLGIAKANITTRNFPLPVAEIKKRFKIRDGGPDYLFFTTDKNGKRIILKCSKA
ncbi:MAG TPA: class I SAM-dependent methyltransferase [Arenibacter sp.]|nr:class I SAM-dependent methyltransferase [Arenibacter sp.]